METKNSKFKKVHVEIPKNIAKVTRKFGIDTFIHLSALKLKNQNFLITRIQNIKEKMR